MCSIPFINYILVVYHGLQCSPEFGQLPHQICFCASYSLCSGHSLLSIHSPHGPHTYHIAGHCLAFTSQGQCSQRRPHSVFFLSARYRLADHPVNFHCNAGKSASLFYLHICVFTYCQTLYKNLSSLMSGTCLAIPLWIPNDSRSACPKIRLSINCW